jgi:hypothetical protein
MYNIPTGYSVKPHTIILWYFILKLTVIFYKTADNITNHIITEHSTNNSNTCSNGTKMKMQNLKNKLAMGPRLSP